jgi:hypothetical protein
VPYCGREVPWGGRDDMLRVGDGEGCRSAAGEGRGRWEVGGGALGAKRAGGRDVEQDKGQDAETGSGIRRRRRRRRRRRFPSLAALDGLASSGVIPTEYQATRTANVRNMDSTAVWALLPPSPAEPPSPPLLAHPPTLLPPQCDHPSLESYSQSSVVLNLNWRNRLTLQSLPPSSRDPLESSTAECQTHPRHRSRPRGRG